MTITLLGKKNKKVMLKYHNTCLQTILQSHRIKTA
jgi:hypothetical protein